MTSLSDFVSNMNWWGLVSMLVSAAAALFCITFHELSHGYVAYRLGDPTAKRAGRLTLNPIKHIDPMGLIMMLTVRVGWAKPVPVDMRNFEKPKQGMALTALAGPASNFLLALLAVGLCSGLSWVYWELLRNTGDAVMYLFFFAMSFLANVAILSVGLGLFNLIPLPPLDGAKVLFSFLPAKAYRTLLRYERYVMLLVVGLTWAGVFSTPLSWLMDHILSGLCTVTRYSENELYIMAYYLPYLLQ